MKAGVLTGSTLSVRVILADGTVEDRGMIFSTKKSDRELNKDKEGE